MQTKLSILKQRAHAGDWHGAIRIAARFPRLGEHKTAITRAWEAIARPDFMRQLKRNPDQLIAEGIDALKVRYGL